MKRNEKRNKRILEHFKQTCSLVKTGKRFKISDERVRQIVKDLGYTTAIVKKLSFLNRYEKAKENIGFGDNLNKKELHGIRYHLGVSYKEVKADNWKQEIVKLHEQGLNRTKISKELGLHYKTVSKYLKLSGKKPGCLRGKATKVRDAKLYADFLKIYETNKISPYIEVAKLYNMTSTNALYCVRRAQGKSIR